MDPLQICHFPGRPIYPVLPRGRDLDPGVRVCTLCHLVRPHVSILCGPDVQVVEMQQKRKRGKKTCEKRLKKEIEEIGDFVGKGEM